MSLRHVIWSYDSYDESYHVITLAFTLITGADIVINAKTHDVTTEDGF